MITDVLDIFIIVLLAVMILLEVETQKILGRLNRVYNQNQTRKGKESEKTDFESD